MVLVANTSNGERWQTTTDARGRYFVEYLTVGGPYRIEVKALGFEPAVATPSTSPSASALPHISPWRPPCSSSKEITVTGRDDPRLSAARTGPAQIIPDSTIARLPVKGRDYTELAILSPQVTKTPNGGLSFAGQHDRTTASRSTAPTTTTFSAAPAPVTVPRVGPWGSPRLRLRR